MNDTDQNMTNSYRHGAYFFIMSAVYSHVQKCKISSYHWKRRLGGIKLVKPATFYWNSYIKPGEGYWFCPFSWFSYCSDIVYFIPFYHHCEISLK